MSLTISGILNAETLSLSTWAMFYCGFATFALLLLLRVPYGRYSTAKGWGPLLPAWLAWMVMESPNLWIPILIYYSRQSVSTNFPGNQRANQVLLTLFLIHYLQRTIIFPLTLKETKPMPLTVMLSAFFYCLWNGYNQSTALLVVHDYPTDWLASGQFRLGLTLFLLGMTLNVYSDQRLLYLRRQARLKGLEYVIPTGGLFSWISCPNYLGEFIEWAGFALACNHWTAAVFALYTVANLLPRALANHSWYKEKFEDYPLERKAVFPFLL
eukprot:gene3165-3465_t